MVKFFIYSENNVIQMSCILFSSMDELHLEIKVMYQGMCLTKVEDIKAIVAQQQFIINKLSSLER